MKRFVFLAVIGSVMFLSSVSSCRPQQEIETVSPKKEVEYVRIITVYKDGAEEVSPIYSR